MSSQQDIKKQKKRKTLKGCKTNNKIQTKVKHWKGVKQITKYKQKKNIERVQDRQQNTNRQTIEKGAK
jgi:hypothetical protein